MHTNPLPESSGTFQPAAQQLGDCPHCRATQCVTIRLWESSCGGYEDEKHTCGRCAKEWWMEGCDS